MKVASTLLPFVALCVAFFVSGCEKRSWTYRYRLTIDVETPEGLRSGSSVLEVEISKAAVAFLDLTNGAVKYRLKGEAIVVDLGPRGVLFSVLFGGVTTSSDAHYAAGVPETAFARIGVLDKNNVAESNWDILESLQGKVELSSDEIPYLVRFKNLQDQKSISLVDPLNITASFGPGVHLKHAAIEMTNNAPTTNIVLKYLPWLANMPDRFFILQDDDFTTIPGQLGSMQKTSFIQ